MCDLGGGSGLVTHRQALAHSARLWDRQFNGNACPQAVREPERVRWIEADARNWSPIEERSGIMTFWQVEYPARGDGRTLYSFRHLFIIATL